MKHKIRAAMAQRDDRYGLEGMVEFDEGHFSIPVKKGTKLKRGKGSQRRANVAVMAESTPLERRVRNAGISKFRSCQANKQKT